MDGEIGKVTDGAAQHLGGGSQASGELDRAGLRFARLSPREAGPRLPKPTFPMPRASPACSMRLIRPLVESTC